MNLKEYKSLSRGISREMSPAAISRRLQIASELYEIAVMFRKSHSLGKVEIVDKDIQNK